jgi:tRNA nucleotidyltransferase (CCA-adding enzyme)
MLLEVDHPEVPTVKVQEGPPAGIDRVGDFLGKWTATDAPVVQGPYVSVDGRLAVESRRPSRDLESLLNEAIGRLPLGRDLKALVDPGTRVEPLSSLSESPELREALAELLAKRLPFLPELSG